MRGLLRNRSLVLLAGAELVTNLGSWITMMAIFALVVFEGEGGVLQTTGIYLAGMGPAILLGPVAGWLVDRVDRRRLLIAAQLLSGLITLGLVFTQQMGWIYLILVLQGICAAATPSARQSVVADLVDRADLTRANAFLQQVSGITKIAAPMLAGAVLGLLSPQRAILLDVISYLAAGALLGLLPALPPRQGTAGPEAKGSEGLAGLRAVAGMILREAPLLRFIFPTIFVLVVTLLAFDVTAPVFTRDVLLGDSRFMGVLVGMVGLGMGLAALALMLGKGGRNPSRDLLLGMLLMVGIPAAISLGAALQSPVLARWIALVGCLAGGAGLGLANVQASTLIQTLAPAGWLGRLGGLFQSVIVAGQVTGMLLTPVLVPHLISLGQFFTTATIAILLLCVWTAGAVKRSDLAIDVK